MKSTHPRKKAPANTPEPSALTPSQFQAALDARDMTVADWARDNAQPKAVVYKLLQGRIKGARGAARRVARAMGLALPCSDRSSSAA